MATATDTQADATPETPTTARYPVPTTAVGLARRTALGTVVAIVTALLVRALVLALDVDVGVVATGQTPFAVGPIVGFTVFAGAGAAVVYAALVRLTERPVRNFAVAAAAFFVVMMGPLLTVAPAQGVTTVGLAVLFVLHVVVAVPLVAFVAGAVRP
jgi:hypothetical protein